MTSRERFEAWCEAKLLTPTPLRYEVWIAAEHDMLERAIAKLAENDSLEIFTDNAIEELKELLNEQH